MWVHPVLSSCHFSPTVHGTTQGFFFKPIILQQTHQIATRHSERARASDNAPSFIKGNPGQSWEHPRVLPSDWSSCIIMQSWGLHNGTRASSPMSKRFQLARLSGSVMVPMNWGPYWARSVAPCSKVRDTRPLWGTAATISSLAEMLLGPGRPCTRQSWVWHTTGAFTVH